MQYQKTEKASKGNAFCWDDGCHSIFMADASFRASKNGMTPSQKSSETLTKLMQNPKKNQYATQFIGSKKAKSAQRPHPDLRRG